MTDLARLVEEVEPGVPARRELTVGGEVRPVLAVVAAAGGGGRALLVLVLDGGDAAPARSEELVQRIWTLVETQLAARARDAQLRA